MEQREALKKIITSKNNSLITETAKLKHKKYRDEKKLFCVEGIKLSKEALNSNFCIKYIIVCEENAGIFERVKGCEIIQVSREAYKKITDESGFEGVMCVLEKPDDSAPLKYDRPVIILDNVQNPGNVGTIIRTADAFLCSDIILTGGCADVYSGKVQRAAMGAVFRQNIKISENIKIELAILKKNGYNIFAACLSENSCAVNSVNFGAKSAVIFGNEGGGLCEDTVKLCDESLVIPMNEGSESLNVAVAAGIILWEMKKQITKTEKIR
ncbi:MAG: RNA methyltransferase [Oscillospiraceae bacterium]|nr:RNA methyltransferase [Oscillospiraceae bacterium]